MEENSESHISDYFVEYNISKDAYRFKWLFENSSLISPVSLTSNEFEPMPSVKFRVTIQKRSSDYMIELYGCTGNSDINMVLCKMVISDGQGKKLFSKSYQNTLCILWKSIEMPIQGDDFKEISSMYNDKVEINLILNLVTRTTRTKQETYEEKFQSNMKNSFVDDLVKAYDKQIGTDVTLNVQEESVQAHKGILCARSPVFAKMFQQEMAESQKNAVDIKDIGMLALKEMLDYMYSKGRRDYDFQTALQIYYAADKYEVINLKDICGEILSNNLSPSNAAEVLLLADQHNDKQLKTKVMFYFNGNLKSCLKENCWFELRDKHFELFKETMEFTG